MSKLLVFILMTLPFQGSILWAAGWYVGDTLRERRRARAAAAEAHAPAREQILQHTGNRQTQPPTTRPETTGVVAGPVVVRLHLTTECLDADAHSECG
jgi:hypothetical protein